VGTPAAGGAPSVAIPGAGTPGDIFAYDRSPPEDARVLARSQAATFDRLEIDFASPAGGRAPAFLLVPRGEGPFPAVLLMHGLPSTRASMRRLAEAYAGAGVAALALAAPYNRPERPYGGGRLIRAPLFDRHDREELIQTVVDLRRALDVLEDRGDIDASAVGFVGHSYGATAGALLAAVESRLAGSVLMVPSNGLVTVALTGFGGLQAAAYAELDPARREAWVRSLLDLEADRWIGLAPPGRGLLQAGRRDERVRPEDTIRLAHAAPGWELRWYDAGHGLSREALREQAAFLAPLLGFDADAFVPPDSIY
jgi:dienelactone hydrolase